MPLSALQFGKAARILADTPEDGFAIATAMRDKEIADGKPATVMEFSFDPDVFYMLSQRECIDATEPPEELQDEFENSDPEDLPGLLAAAMQYVHRQIASLAEEFDFRLQTVKDGDAC